jgi:hypothetical protein
MAKEELMKGSVPVWLDTAVNCIRQKLLGSIAQCPANSCLRLFLLLFAISSSSLRICYTSALDINYKITPYKCSFSRHCIDRIPFKINLEISEATWVGAQPLLNQCRDVIEKSFRGWLNRKISEFRVLPAKTGARFAIQRG